MSDSSRSENSRGGASAPDRREVFRVGLKWVLGGAAMGGFLSSVQSLSGRDPESPGGRGPLGVLRPPGALDEEAFLDHCLRCTRCADACESGCIKFFGPTAGAMAGTPYIVSVERACTLCLECGASCPSGSLRPLTDRRQAAMGLAVVDERLCVSHNGTGVCGACHTVCPFRNKALTLGLRNAPTIHEDHCVGCGLCEEACIVKDRTAIRVVSGRPWPV